MSRRVIGVLISLVLAALGTWIIVNYVRSADDRALEGQEAVEVLVVDVPIAKGTPASDVSTLVKPQRLPAISVARGAVTDLTQIEGRFAAVDLVPGEQLVASRFVAREALVEVVEIEVPPELLEVTVQLSPDRVLGGELMPGDLVAVVASFQPFQLDAVEPTGTQDLQEFIEGSGDPDAQENPEPLRTPNTSHIVMQKILVTNIQFGSLPQTQETTTTGEVQTAQSQDLAPTGNILVTLAMDAPDVEKLVFTAEFGTVWLAKETPQSGEGGIEIQTRGTIYL